MNAAKLPRFFGPQFKFVSKSLSDCRPDPVADPAGYELWDKIVRTQAHDLSRTNTNFNKAAFFRIAGLSRKEKHED